MIDLIRERKAKLKEVNMAPTSRWYYHFPNNAYAYGPTTDRYGSEREVRKLIKK